MDFGALINIALYQLMTARDAPLPIVLTAIVVGLLVWALTKWWYSAKMHNLKRAMVRRDAELAVLRAQPVQAAPVADDVTAEESVEKVSAPTSAHRRALQLVLNALDQADVAEQSSDPRETDRALATMALAMQTVHRMFGLTVPGLDADPVANLQTGRLFLEQVRPALRAGDEEEAKRVAGRFVTNLAAPSRMAG